jgi:hypothetical protein
MGKKKKLPEIDPELIIDLVGIKRNTGSKISSVKLNKDQSDTNKLKSKENFLD